MSFKVGEEVLCVKTNPGTISSYPGCVKGKEYVVLRVLNCNCGSVAIDIGTVLDIGVVTSSCGICGYIRTYSDSIWWQRANRFVRKSSASFADEILNSIVKEVEISI